MSDPLRYVLAMSKKAHPRLRTAWSPSRAAIERSEERWAELAREFGYSAVAREMGLTPEAVRKRVLRILGPP